MRDTIGCANNMSCDAVYKEVVVVGNGPSALGLSYLLAGNCPHYNGLPHPSDEMLTARLHSIPPGRSLLQADLQFLTQGVEGRSRNPVSVLMDSLTHPAADLGVDSAPLVSWRPHPDTAVDHIVLGKGPPGGTWQAMDGNVLTISLSSWMELPGLEWRRWEARHNPPAPTTTARRVPVALVAAYYRDYVRLMRLGRYFRSGVVVTSVQRLNNQGGDQSGEEGEGCRCHWSRVRWAVQGYDLATGAGFSYVCRHLVLATGTTDRHNDLAVPGEHANPDWVFHDLAAFEAALATFIKDNPRIKDGVDPVCIVGAGLSASDAVLASRFHSLPIIHVYRHAGVSPEHMLPENMYPEYHKVHQMMSARGQGYPDYRALSEHRVVDISAAGDRKVTTVSPSGLRLVHQVSLMAVLIGSRPDLSFLPHDYQEGQALTVEPSRPLDCRSNPLAISPWSHNVANIPGLYALGPLTGDNFVRFLLGGAVAITGDILRHRKHVSA